MIIECINCHKKFEVESSLIPESGRKIQCGSCNHIWFYKEIENVSKDEIKIEDDNNINAQNINELDKKKIKDKPKKNNLNFSKFLSYLVVGIISFVAIIVILDTFKSPLKKIFPNLEILLFNLNETLKDIFLFIKNLLQ
mgnify:CR=1 FL=1|tara:strand:- start:271 stop:687 length:417 start_codon:yes stop_codon:yes gene_type:complete